MYSLFIGRGGFRNRGGRKSRSRSPLRRSRTRSPSLPRERDRDRDRDKERDRRRSPRRRSPRRRSPRRRSHSDTPSSSSGKLEEKSAQSESDERRLAQALTNILGGQGADQEGGPEDIRKESKDTNGVQIIQASAVDESKPVNDLRENIIVRKSDKLTGDQSIQDQSHTNETSDNSKDSQKHETAKLLTESSPQDQNKLPNSNIPLQDQPRSLLGNPPIDQARLTSSVPDQRHLLGMGLIINGNQAEPQIHLLNGPPPDPPRHFIGNHVGPPGHILGPVQEHSRHIIGGPPESGRPMMNIPSEPPRQIIGEPPRLGPPQPSGPHGPIPRHLLGPPPVERHMLGGPHNGGGLLPRPQEPPMHMMPGPQANGPRHMGGPPPRFGGPQEQRFLIGHPPQEPRFIGGPQDNRLIAQHMDNRRKLGPFNQHPHLIAGLQPPHEHHMGEPPRHLLGLPPPHEQHHFIPNGFIADGGIYLNGAQQPHEMNGQAQAFFPPQQWQQQWTGPPLPESILFQPPPPPPPS